MGPINLTTISKEVIMKKILSLCLFCVLLVSNTFTSLASTPELEPIKIEGKLVNSEVLSQTRSANTTSYADTYEYTIQPRATGQVEDDGWDKTYVLHAYMTIYYTKTDVTLGSEYRLDKVTGYWQGPDSGVTVQSASVTYGCVKLGDSSQRATRNVTSNFTINTGFTRGVEDWAPGAAVGANLNITLYRGGSWNFVLTNNIIG